MAVLSEPPSAETERSASLLGLGALPTASDYTELFLLQLYPYASVYLGPEGMVGGEALDRIAGFWRALGEAPPSEPDHLAVLLAAYAGLADREATAGDGRARSRWQHARAAFLWEHLLSWLPVYLDRVQEIGSRFYRSWSELVSAALLEEARGRTLPDRLPLHLRQAPGLGTLDEVSAEDFLNAVTTPVRTGMILTRADLVRCGRSLGLALRQAERRYALRSIMAQEPRETLEWLASEADRRAKGYREQDPWLAPISSFWRQRAETCSVLLRESAAALSRI